MTDKETILAEIERLRGEYKSDRHERYAAKCVLDKIIHFINSLPEEPEVENPEYSFIETIYRCGKKPNWNIGDTLAYYKFTSNEEGEIVLGKITNVELDEEYEDWFYTFEDGYQVEEESLLINETYKKN